MCVLGRRRGGGGVHVELSTPDEAINMALCFR